MPPAWALWHASLCAFAVVNAVGWLSAARRLTHRAVVLPEDVLATRRLLLWLSAVSAAVWLSIALVDTPPLRLRRAARVGVKVAALPTRSVQPERRASTE